MKYTQSKKTNAFLIAYLIYVLTSYVASGRSIKIRTSKPTPATRPFINYPKVKVSSPQKPVKSVISAPQHRIETRQDGFEMPNTVNESTQDIIQTTFNSGFRQVFQFLRNLAPQYFTENGNVNEESTTVNEATQVKLPGLPTSPLFHQLDVSSVVKLLEATDGSQVEILAEAAVIDLVSQLVKIIGFNDLRDWLGITLMYFILGPILIPLFWLPISLFGMAGLLAPLFFFNPPSKPNLDVMGHDPIFPEELAGEKRSYKNDYMDENVLKALSFPSIHKNLAQRSPTDIIESCMERVSCHLTRLYRANPLTKWLTSHFNTTKVEWARLHPGDDINENGISSWEDCKKYECTVFPAA